MKYKLFLGAQLVVAEDDLPAFIRQVRGRIDPPPVEGMKWATHLRGERVIHDSASINRHVTSAPRGVLLVGKRDGYRCRSMLKVYPPQAYTVIWNHEAAQHG